MLGAERKKMWLIEFCKRVIIVILSKRYGEYVYIYSVSTIRYAIPDKRRKKAHQAKQDKSIFDAIDAGDGTNIF